MQILWMTLQKPGAFKHFNVKTWLLFTPHIKISGYVPVFGTLLQVC